MPDGPTEAPDSLVAKGEGRPPKPGDGADVLDVGIVLLPDFSLMSFACLVEPMRGANRRSGRTLYRWQLLSCDGQAIRASNGLPFATGPLPDPGAELPDVLVVCGGHADAHLDDRRLRELLRRASRSDRIVGAVSTASFLLAAAGLLDGRRCTTHWEYLDSFSESFPSARLCGDRHVTDGRIFTCGGGLSSIDAMLDLIGRREGRAFANEVAENFIHVPPERSAAGQRLDLSERLGSDHPVLLGVAALMEANTESPLAIPVIAQRAGASQRQIERLFRRHLGLSPAQFYLATRLEKARKLLHHSRLSVTEVGLSCGFTSLPHFSRSYRRHFGISPGADRAVPTATRRAQGGAGPPRA